MTRIRQKFPPFLRSNPWNKIIRIVIWIAVQDHNFACLNIQCNSGSIFLLFSKCIMRSLLHLIIKAKTNCFSRRRRLLVLPEILLIPFQNCSQPYFHSRHSPSSTCCNSVQDRPAQQRHVFVLQEIIFAQIVLRSVRRHNPRACAKRSPYG